MAPGPLTTESQSSWKVFSGSNPELLVKALWGRSLVNCRTTAPRPKAAKGVLAETPTSSSLIAHSSPLDCQGTLSNFPLMITRRGSKNKITSLYSNIENCVARSLLLWPGALIFYPCSLCRTELKNWEFSHSPIRAGTQRSPPRQVRTPELLGLRKVQRLAGRLGQELGGTPGGRKTSTIYQPVLKHFPILITGISARWIVSHTSTIRQKTEIKTPRVQ